jgi:hypothetical protein
MCLQGLSLNPIKMEDFHGLIYGSAAAASGVPATNARYDFACKLYSVHLLSENIFDFYFICQWLKRHFLIQIL